MNLLNDPLLFSEENIKKIESVKNAVYVCDTEMKDILVSIFYGDTPHPVSNSRYFGLYYTPEDNILMITDGSFVETQTFYGAVANNGDVIYSRYRHDYRSSPDDSVFIDGGRAYTRTNTKNIVSLKVTDGILKIEGE